jgi:catechol 2,3-dioxygenase-like lactoylglutathione lyase family enzyme
MKSLTLAALVAVLAAVSSRALTHVPQSPTPEPTPMQLGAFSVSLTVKDLPKSRAFYEKLGFRAIAGVPEQNWLILQNGTTTIGLFQGMFERNIMTFNPGWTSSAEPMEDFEDIREIQRRLEAAGLELTTKADPESTGPASLTLSDPDGNPILFDQHVPKPKR